MAGCPLCGERVPFGKMLGHKRLVHGEGLPPGKRVRVAATTAGAGPAPPLTNRPKKAKKRKHRAWVSVYQGGLPSLGKRR